jgi:N-acetylglucosaminyl-diphospho-decaprenol L-rhamnosyltransferase
MTRQRPTTAVVTLAHGRHDHLRLQHRSLCAGGALPDLYVVVAMDDPGLHSWRPEGGAPPVVVPLDADPDALPLAAARNAGAATALEAGADVLVFLDVDCLAGDALVASYTRAAVGRPDVLWSGPVTYLPPAPPTGYDLRDLDDLDDPHPARPAPEPGTSTLGSDPDLFWSLSFAVHRDGWLRTGGFCEEYVGYGGEDTDFARVARREGLELGWLGSARASHQHHPVEKPPVRHVEAILRNGRVFRDRWGHWPMTGWLADFERLGLVTERDGEWHLRPDPHAGAGRGYCS